jgi:hypothetical protein
MRASRRVRRSSFNTGESRRPKFSFAISIPAMRKATRSSLCEWRRSDGMIKGSAAVGRNLLSRVRAQWPGAFLAFLPFVWQEPEPVSAQFALTSPALVNVLRSATSADNFEMRTAAGGFSVRGQVNSGGSFEDVKKRRYFSRGSSLVVYFTAHWLPHKTELAAAGRWDPGVFYRSSHSRGRSPASSPSISRSQIMHL